MRIFPYIIIVAAGLTTCHSQWSFQHFFFLSGVDVAKVHQVVGSARSMYFFNEEAMSEVIKGIGHFGLSVSDLDESIHFYAVVLGLEMSERRAQDAFFRVGENDVLALLQYPGGAERFDAEMRPKNRGKAFTHFGLMAESSESVFKLQEHLKACGVDIVKEAYERWDGAGVYFLDPNGYTLEFIYFDPEGR